MRGWNLTEEGPRLLEAVLEEGLLEAVMSRLTHGGLKLDLVTVATGRHTCW